MNRIVRAGSVGLLVLAAALSPCFAGGASPGGADSDQIVILYTSDEHGWIEQSEVSDGAARLYGLWTDTEADTDDESLLVLSGGDMWTGPAISTWSQGESTVEVMNAMGYDAAAAGNHEFDFGIDAMWERAAEMEFPLLAANVVERETGRVPEFLRSHVIVEAGGFQVGIIGLASLQTPSITRQEAVAPFEFLDYAPTLRDVVPQVRAEGAQIIVVISHLCPDEMVDLVPVAKELGVSVVGGGHCHVRFAQVIDGVALVEAGCFLESYGRVVLHVNDAGDVVSATAAVHANERGAEDPAVAGIVRRWSDVAGETLSVRIGYVEHEIARGEELFTMVLNAWLAAYPADVALSNLGGFRQAIPAGEITVGTIVGVLPFDNHLVDVELTGRQLLETLAWGSPAIAGVDPNSIDPAAIYRVLVNDFIYAGGDGYYLDQFDPDAYHTGIGWRQPVIDWLVSLGTSPENPLDSYLP